MAETQGEQTPQNEQNQKRFMFASANHRLDSRKVSET